MILYGQNILLILPLNFLSTQTLSPVLMTTYYGDLYRIDENKLAKINECSCYTNNIIVRIG